MNYFKGLMAVTFTRFDDSDKINLVIIPAYVDKMIGDGLMV